MDRRAFLANGATFILGSILGANRPSRAELFIPPSSVKPRIALIIDDIGFNLKRAELFLKADIPMTFSILPRLCWSAESALALSEKGHDIMLHQPMEPAGSGVDPGPGAIYVDDRAARVRAVMRENLAALPPVVGVNNHMGSRYTQESSKMRQALDVVRNRGLFFVDSLTTNRSTGYACARQMGISAIRRDLFLDIRRNALSVSRQMEKLRQRALRCGVSVGIGHPRKETVEGILRFLDAPHSDDVEFAYIARLV